MSRSLPKTIAASIGSMFAIVLVVLLFQLNKRSGVAVCANIHRPIVIAELNWSSARLNTAVMANLLANGFGCEIEIIPGSSVPITKALVRNNIDVVPEIWRNTVPDSYELALEEGVIVEFSTNFESTEGWYIPRYLVANPQAPAFGLRSVQQLSQYAYLFSDSPEVTSSKGVFNNCISSWFCYTTNTQKLAAYGLNDFFINTTPAHPQEFDSVLAGKYQAQEPWIGYYWSPSEALASLDLVKLEEPAYTEECWQTDRACSYPPAIVKVAGSAKFANRLDAELTRFYQDYNIPANILQKYLAESNSNVAAQRLLLENQNLWSSWMNSERKEQVIKGLTLE